MANTETLTLKQKLMLSLGVPLVFLVLAELVARIFVGSGQTVTAGGDMQLDMPTWMQMDKNAESKRASLTSRPEAIEWLTLFESGPGFRVRLIPGSERRVSNSFSLLPSDRNLGYLIHANSLGFRSPEIAQTKQPGTFRILVFGDSSSFGWGVEQNESYSALLQEQLQTRFPGRRFEVGNFAIPGDSSEYGRLIADRFTAKFSPDLVILGFGANDAKRALVPHQAQVDNFRSSKNLQLLRFWLEKSALFRGLENTLRALTPKPSAAAPQRNVKQRAVPPKRYQDNLGAMATEAKTAGAQSVLLLNLCTPNDYSKRAETVARKGGYLYLNGQQLLLEDLDQLVKGALYPQMVADLRKRYGEELSKDRLLYVTSDLCHPNAVGHRIVADALVQKIEPLIHE